jgi:hypothetical protein
MYGAIAATGQNCVTPFAHRLLRLPSGALWRFGGDDPDLNPRVVECGLHLGNLRRAPFRMLTGHGVVD